ncbi:MAG: carboxypeptidase regulatory-like domain-containing protein [Acidobacteriota bacterium]
MADAAKTKAQQENVRLMEEQGRQELLAGNTTRALAWLNEAYKSGDTSPELRFMLGTAMRRVESVVRELDCRVPDGNDTPGIAFSPDGTLGLAACGSAVGIARVSDWTIVRTIETRTQGAVWSHDGRHIANKDGGVLSVWDVATGARVFTTKAHGGAIRSVMFTPDDRLVITTGDDRMARMWDAATGAAVRAIEVGTAQMNVVRGQLTPDGKTLVTVTGDGAVKEWEVATGAAIRGFQLGVQSFGKGSLSPDGARLATCHVDGTVRISDLASGRVVSTFAAHATAALECQFSPNGRWLVTTGADGAARVWDIEHGQLVSSLDQLGVFSRAVVSPDGERVATLGSDGIVRMWHAATGSLLGSFDDPSGMSGGLLFSPDGHVLVVPRENSSILVIRDLDAGMQPVAIPPGTIAISGSLLHASGDRLAVRAQDGEVTIIDTATSAPVSHEPLREPIAWSMDGRRLAGVAKDGVVVLDGRDGHAIARIAVRSPDAVALDEHGRRLLVAMAHSQIWDVEHARVELDLGGRSDGGSLSPDGAVALSWRDRRHVEVWNVDQRQIQSRIALDDDVMGAVGYAADRRHVLLAVADARTMVFPIPNAGRIGGYDLATGARGYELPRAFLTFLAPDRRRVVAAGIGRDLEIRETSDGSLVSRIASGSEPTIAGTLVRDGTLLLALTLRHIDVRSAVDGRLLARMNAELQAEVTQDSYHVGGAFDLADAGRAAVSLGAHPWIWHLPSEQRPPDVVDKIVRQRVLWRVFDGGLVAVEATLHGRVLRHGHPVPGATVTVEHIGSLSWPHVLSAADGRYAFDHMPLGRIEVSAMAPDGSAHGLSRVALDRDDVIADIELDQEATISGVVVDESGAPVPGVLVTAKGTFLDGKSDAAGRFTIHALRPGKFDVAVAESDAHVGVARVTVELKSKTDAVTGVQLVVRSLR